MIYPALIVSGGSALIFAYNQNGLPSIIAVLLYIMLVILEFYLHSVDSSTISRKYREFTTAVIEYEFRRNRDKVNIV
jgi:hypothetical protein